MSYFKRKLALLSLIFSSLLFSESTPESSEFEGYFEPNVPIYNTYKRHFNCAKDSSLTLDKAGKNNEERPTVSLYQGSLAAQREADREKMRFDDKQKKQQVNRMMKK